jgi:N6-adenosine-specific RNA methylase IME4
LIERTSPPPRLKLFARKRATGWYSWGHEIAEPLIDQSAD